MLLQQLLLAVSLKAQLLMLLLLLLQVRAHGASNSAYASYAAKLHTFYLLQCRQAAAYSLYAATTTFLPSVVVAVVLYYGGMLVLDDKVGWKSGGSGAVLVSGQ